MTDTFEQLAANVRQWASDRQILQHSTAEAQLWKLEEERRETLEDMGADDPIGILDGFGDMLVCLINAAAIAGVDPTEALAHAWDEIKDRRGYLNSDGVFVKEEQSDSI